MLAFAPLRSVALSFCAVALALVVAPAARAQTFSNTAAINFATSESDGRATLYPSPIVVSGAPASIGYVSVTLNGFSHTFVSDVRVLLVSPTGQKILLMANTNGSRNANNNTLTFIPDGTATLPDNDTNVVSGVYACSVYAASAALPTPAPAGPYGTSLAPLTGTNPNGTWNLYVWDDVPDFDDGTFAGGWSIGFSSTPPGPIATAFTYQGLLSAGGTPINGNANVRFTLCTSPIVPTAFSAVATPITRSFTGVTGGQITTTLDFGTAIDANQALWLDIEVESPPGSGFVTLAPRHPITPTPQARVAQRAVLADTATNATNATTATTATQLAPGRARIRGDAGIAGNSPGIWFTSPIAAPVDRSFIGQLDDNNVGVFNAGWRLLVNSNGNTVLGDSTGAAPPERLTVNGSVQSNNAANSGRLNFGPTGDQGNSAENTDAVFFQRVNTGTDVTELRLIIGDNNSTSGTDSLRICTTSTGGGILERFRFQSDGQAFKPGGGTWAALSDPRAKHDVAPLAGTLDKLMNLRGYSFLYNDDRIATGIALPGTQIGLMADEVARVFPDWVSTDASGTRYVTERATTALMVEALRDLRAEKDRQIAAQSASAQAQIDALRAENNELKARLDRLERRDAKP
jgi:subtilisin-like proprotein convertase family protein